MEFLLNINLFCAIFSLTFGQNNVIEDTIDLSYLGSRIYGKPNQKIGDIIKDWENNQSVQSVNPEELGSYVEGDILIPKEIMGRNGMLAETYRWPGGKVPYEIRGKFLPNERALIMEAIDSYHKNTCIQFVPRSADDKDYISIQNSESGCWSSVGRVGGPQVVNLQNPGCVYKVGTVMHEFMHAIGFLHEQNREERDDFVSIQFQNIQKGTESNFEKVPKGTTTSFGISYDFGSVMHYSAKAFSSNGKPTITPKVYYGSI